MARHQVRRTRSANSLTYGDPTWPPGMTVDHHGAEGQTTSSTDSPPRQEFIFVQRSPTMPPMPQSSSIHIRLALLALAATSLWTAPLYSEPSPHWLRIPGSGDRPASCVFEKIIHLEHRPRKATLSVFTDFSRCRVRLDGNVVGDFEGILEEPTVDLSSRLSAGKHVLLVDAYSPTGPGAVAVEVQLVSESGAAHRIASDETWRVASAGRTWGPVATTGAVSSEVWGHRPPRPSVDALDDYNQWTQARGAHGSDDEARFSPLKDFSIERLRSARPDEGSWIGLTFDPKGRVIISRDDHGLLRLSLDDLDAAPEHLAKSLKGCRGLAWRGNVLFANERGSRTLYRLQDTNNDDRFDVIESVMKTPGGGVDHGRNDLTTSPDGFIYSAHGEGVKMVDPLHTAVPATYEFGKSGHPIGGHLVRTDGANHWEVVATGLRNPFGIAVNRDGEPFTFDADAESDQGLPWYRPTRITHIVSGADYGWRRGNAKWPAYAADSLPATLDVGKASPTGMTFGYGSAFPPPYRKALFTLDWTYGRVLVVHLHRQGGSYRARAETFLRGRPLNVTDLSFGRDGALYLVTGGRKTQSSLYRISYVGSQPSSRTTQRTSQKLQRERYSESARELRRELESLHRPGTKDVIDRVWPRLAHADRWIRHSARIALEHQNTAIWKDRALKEEDPGQALAALLALVRVGPDRVLDDVLRRLKLWKFNELETWQQQSSVRTAAIVDVRQKTKDPERSSAIVELFAAHFPTGTQSIDRELCSLLANHGANAIPTRALRLFARTADQRDRFLYLSILADIRDDWTPSLRDEYFAALKGAQFFQGDQQLARLVRDMEARALSLVPEKHRERYERVLERSVRTETPAVNRSLVKKWTAADLEPDVVERSREHDIERGKRTFEEASCSRCHRFGALGRPYGPDLTAVASRFGRRDLLTAILSPSEVIPEQHRMRVLTLRDGTVLTGQLVRNEFRDAIVHIATEPTNLDQTRKVKKDDILTYQSSPTSPMPEGLLDTFTRGEILDLLAFLRSDAK